MLEPNMTVREAAVKLGVTLTHVYGLVQVERLPGAFKKDGVWVVPRAAVDNYLKQRQRRTGSALSREQIRGAEMTV